MTSLPGVWSGGIRPTWRGLRAARVLVALTALLALGLAVAPVRAAAEINWGTPTATATYGKGITFEQPVATSGIEARWIELLLTQPGVPGQQVRTVTQVGTVTQTTFNYDLLESNGHLFPNTTFTGAWRITATDGTVYEGPPVSVTYADTRFDWQTKNGSLIHVHWYRGNDAFGQRALEIGEAGIKKAEDLLGVTETALVDFYIYADLPAFYNALGPAVPENVGGIAISETRTLFALITPDQIDQSWVGTVIPHELTHLVFHSAIDNPFHEPPHWLNEGLAVYLTEGYGASDKGLVADAVRDQAVIPLSGLVGDFPGERDKFQLSYAEAVSAVDFIVRTYGRDALVKLVQSYATGLTDAQAFAGALGLDDAAFAKAWMADVKAIDPTAYGPQPDPAGPLPSGWSAQPEAGAPAALPTLAASPGPSSGPGGSPAASGATLPPIGPSESSGPASPASVSAVPSVPSLAPGSPAASVAPAASIASLPSGPAGGAGTTTGRQPNPTLAIMLGLLAAVAAGAGVALIALRRQPQPQ